MHIIHLPQVGAPDCGVGHCQIRETFIDIIADRVRRPARIIQTSRAENNNATPKAATWECKIAWIGDVIRSGRENNRASRSADCVEFSADANIEISEVIGGGGRRTASCRTLNDRTGVDGENSIIHHIGEAI